MSAAPEDYGMVGDCETVALVGRSGSIDWLCWLRFDSDACFAALLGTRENGRWLLAPASPVKNNSRRYRDHTLILETRFASEDGEVTVIDFMAPEQPFGSGPHRARGKWASPHGNGAHDPLYCHNSPSGI